MTFKSEIYQKDYLFWITPFVILFLIFCVIRSDNKERDSAILNQGTFHSDSTLTLNENKAVRAGKIEIADSTYLFFAGIKGSNPR
jgi:hypothetical protein